MATAKPRLRERHDVRLFVTGPTGGGKTTWAARLAEEVGAPLHALDDLHWVRHPSGDRRRQPLERQDLLGRIVREDAWVLEGVQFKVADSAMERADFIVVLDVPLWRNIARILRRFAGRTLSSPSHPRGTVTALREELGWLADYHLRERNMLFAALSQWPEKILVARDRDEMRAVERSLCAALTR